MLPGKPESIVCDQDKAISAGVEMHWGKWSAVNLIHQCEHHLGERGKAAFTSDKLPPEDPVRKLFHGALQTREQWDLFEAEVRSRPKLLMTNGWVERNATWLRAQTISRPRIPPVYSNGAVEQPLRAFKLALSPRAFTFRNRARLNQLLTLMVLAHRKVDNVTDYSTGIRAYLEDHKGDRTRSSRDDRSTHKASSRQSQPRQFGGARSNLTTARSKHGTLRTLVRRLDARMERRISVSFVAPPLLFDLESHRSHQTETRRIDCGATGREHTNSLFRESKDGCCRYCSADPAAAMGAQNRSEVIVARAIHNLPDDDRNQDAAVKSPEDSLARLPQATNRFTLGRCLKRRGRERVVSVISQFELVERVGVLHRQLLNRDPGCLGPSHRLLNLGEIRRLRQAQPRTPALADQPIAGSFEIGHLGILGAHNLNVTH